MRISAYVLAADPTWLNQSVEQYYDIVEKIVVSYDETARGWTGAPVQTAECLARLRALDSSGKLVFAPGDYGSQRLPPMIAETFQRAAALRLAGSNVDWVLQIDSDEFLPDPNALLAMLELAAELSCVGVEWPMRVLYRKHKAHVYEVAEPQGLPHFEYPGPIAVRPWAVLTEARRIEGKVLRPAVLGDTSLQIRRGDGNGVTQVSVLAVPDAIFHNSWARRPKVTWKKIRSWSHASGFMSTAYFTLWLISPIIWRVMRDFHPFSRGLWPTLRAVNISELPEQLRSV